MTEEKIVLFKRHVCSEGLTDAAVAEISEQCELVKLESGDYLHRANTKFESVYLLIHGRIKQTIYDIRGNVILRRFHTGGAQFGALACALDEPTPMDLVAEEPTRLLRLEYRRGLALTKKYDDFRKNFTKMIAEAVMNLVMKERSQMKPAIVAVFHQSPATRPLTPRLIKRLQELGESPRVLNDQRDWQPMEGVPYFCIVEDGKYISAEDVREKVKKWSDLKRVFLDVSTSMEVQRATKVFEVSEKVLWCVTPDNWKESVSRLNLILERSPSWHDKVNVVWLLPGDSPWAPLAPEFKTLAKRNFKLSFQEPPKIQSRELFNGLERIVHQLRGIRIGVALGGGAALGMAHLGVLKVLEENGIVIDMIAGTSVGAMTGILYASSMEPDYNVNCFIKDLQPSWLFRHMPNGGYWYLLYKYRRRQFDPMLRKYLKNSRLEQLTLPVRSITVDLIGGEAVVRSEGDSVHAITESINLPVLSVPINRDGRALVDGGIVNNVPADVLASEGCNFVIAVSVTAKINPEFAKNRSDTPTSKMKSASAIKTILRTYVVQNVNMNSVGVAPADFIIQPDVTDFDITEFTRADEMAAIGKQTTSEAIPELKGLLSQLDKPLFGN